MMRVPLTVRRCERTYSQDADYLEFMVERTGIFQPIAEA